MKTRTYVRYAGQNVQFGEGDERFDFDILTSSPAEAERIAREINAALNDRSITVEGWKVWPDYGVLVIEAGGREIARVHAAADNSRDVREFVRVRLEERDAADGIRFRFGEKFRG